MGKRAEQGQKASMGMGKMGTRQIRTGVAPLRQHCHRCGAPGGGQAETTSEMASADIRTLRTQEAGTDVDIWGHVREGCGGGGGAWDRLVPAGTKLRMNEDVGLPKVGLAETDVGCLD